MGAYTLCGFNPKPVMVSSSSAITPLRDWAIMTEKAERYNEVFGEHFQHHRNMPGKIMFCVYISQMQSNLPQFIHRCQNEVYKNREILS